MEHILHSLTDEELSHIGRLRSECAMMRDKEMIHRQQISALEEQNKHLRSGYDALLCELRVAEADFRIQQNMINEVYYLTEDRLKSLDVDVNSHSLSLESTSPAAFQPREVVSTRSTSMEERSSVAPQRREVGQPAAPNVPRSSISTIPVIVTEKKREQPLVTNGKSCLKASASASKTTPAPAVAPEPKNEPLTPEQVKARANALRRSQLKKPVCWLFQEGKCTSGAQCRESHDTVPFEFCRAYNDTGVCPNRANCTRKHILFDYEQSVMDASETLKHRQIDAASAKQAAEAWKLNMEERERLEKVRQEERQRHRTVYTRDTAGTKTYSTPYLGQAAMDRAAQEQRERERVQREERAARMNSLSASDGIHGRKGGEKNGDNTSIDAFGRK